MMKKEIKPYYDLQKVSQAADGKWLEILDMLGGGKLTDAVSRAGRHVTCPVHGTNSRNAKGNGFRLFKNVADRGAGCCNTCGTFGNGFALLSWLYSQSFEATLAQVAQYLRVAPDNEAYLNRTQKEALKANAFAQSTPEFEARKAELQKRREQLEKERAIQSKHAAEKIAKLDAEAESIQRSMPPPVIKYFKSRQIVRALRHDNNLDKSIRFHSSLPYYEENKERKMVLVGHFPALVLSIRSLSGELLTLHRIFLSQDGNKANVEDPRKMLGLPDGVSISGSAIQLGGMPTNGVLSIAEGLETAMSVMSVYKMPVWSCTNATLLSLFRPPPGIHTLFVWADKDVSGGGIAAVDSLKEALAESGVNVVTFLPQRPIPNNAKSIDWNDILIDEGMWGFPAWNIVNKLIEEGQNGTR